MWRQIIIFLFRAGVAGHMTFRDPEYPDLYCKCCALA